MKSLLNERVAHIKFGDGVIVGDRDHDRIIIMFDNLEKKFKFEYPDAFESFLRFKKSLLQENALEELGTKRKKIENEKAERMVEFFMEYEELNKGSSKKTVKRTRKNS